MEREQAEARALEVLAWLVREQELLPVFLGASGLGEADLRQRAGDPDLLAALLDFVLMDDAWVMQACDATGLAYGQLAAVRAALPGGGEVHWT